jgi:predicted nucleotidyltransferase
VNSLSHREQAAAESFLKRIKGQFNGRLLSVLLFGSRARGEADGDSDMDVAVVIDRSDRTTRRRIRDLATEAWLDNGIYISTRIWSRAQWKKLKDARTLLYQNIEREGIELLDL